MFSNFFVAFFVVLSYWNDQNSDKGKKRLLFDTREGSHPHIWDLGDFDSKLWASTKVWVRAPSCRDEQTQCQRYEKLST